MLPSLLSTDLNNIDISRPLIDATQTRVRVTSVSVEPGKKDPNMQLLVIKLETLYPVKSVKGETINPGFSLTDTILVTPTGGMTEERILQSLKRFRVACGRDGDSAFGEPDSYIGSEVDVKITVEKDKEGKYDDQNRVRYVVPR